MLAAGRANGRRKVLHSLNASVRISMRLFASAQKAAIGKTAEKKKT